MTRICAVAAHEIALKESSEILTGESIDLVLPVKI
jgi:hypothetical protein